MGCSICIVDHDLASRGFLRECLEKEGYQIVTCDNAYQIKTHLLEKHFHLFILNTNSPGVREKGLLLELQKSNQPKILLIVSERGDPFLKEAIEAGVYGFLYRPFNLQEVYMMLNHITR